MTYQGYTNRQTWAVALWIDNDYSLYNQVLATVADVKATVTSKADWMTDSEYITHWSAECIKELVENDNPLADQADLYSDLLSHALAVVDWVEVAQHYIEEG